MRKLATGYPLAFVLVLGSAVTGCELLDPDLWKGGGGTGSGGSTGGGGSGGGGGEGAVCAGIAGLRCGDGLWCEFDAGICGSAADHTGTCRRKPQVCADIYQPVCGCDDKTYGNDCERQGQAVSKLHDGPCKTPDGGGEGAVCGGLTRVKCAVDLFCEVEAEVCNSIDDVTGVCRRVPEACTQQYAPVCGCDNRTYGNDCVRRGAGVSKLHDGECRNGQEGSVCGGLAGFPCARGLFCEEEPGVCAIIADGTGICRPQPTACTREYVPVCGCDRVTYGNDCTRRAAGVSKVADGPC